MEKFTITAAEEPYWSMVTPTGDAPWRYLTEDIAMWPPDSTWWGGALRIPSRFGSLFAERLRAAGFEVGEEVRP